MKSRIIGPLFCLFVLLAVSAHAARPAVTINPAGNGKFSVQGASMDGVAGIQMDIFYDSSLLVIPSVAQGALVSGAMMAANTGVPGKITVAIVSTSGFRGAGEILSISFSSQSGIDGVTKVVAKMIDLKGVAIASDATITTSQGIQKEGGFIAEPGVPFSKGQQEIAQTTAAPVKVQTAAQGTTIPSGSVGTLTMTSDSNPSPQPVKESEKVYSEPVKSPEAPVYTPPIDLAPVIPKQKVEEMKHTVITGVLERFRMYRGERTPQILAALFSKKPSMIFTQAPDIAVSDGISVVTVTADLTGAQEAGAPNFALSEAKLVSLKMGDKPGTWTVELVPVKGSLRAALTVLAGSTTTEVPITEVIPVKGLYFTEAESLVFYRDNGAAKPEYDLNGDAKHDYIDDFIYTAHYILQKSTVNSARKK